jgi:hypothetical protein
MMTRSSDDLDRRPAASHKMRKRCEGDAALPQRTTTTAGALNPVRSARFGFCCGPRPRSRAA